ncbi:MAG: helix-turn-helix transcriptional regulator [Tildeniella nuda ZEHNDER 1965/U140]|jgi:DNA-binding CsgD family transcriptional regulator|nr:helix-turn-helix transcriptional regulator [Tildeniella nuda ZEHNDER 1965/U140]
MESLSLSDTQNLHQGIQKLYTLHNLDTFGVDALSILNQLVPSDIPTFHVTYVRTRQTSDTHLPGFPGFTPEMKRVRLQHFDEHPVIHHMPQTLNGVYKVSDFVSQKKLHCLEGFYQQFLRLVNIEDQMVFFLPNANSGNWCNLAQTDATLVGFALHRTQRNFMERDRLILDLLRPHLFQAYSNAQHYQRLQQDLSQLQQSLNPLGLMILDTEGQVQFVTPQAIVWLEAYFAKPTGNFQLPDHLWAWIKHQVTSAQTDLPKACLPLRIEQTDKQLVIRLVVEPGNQYLLFLEEQTLPVLNSLKLLGLSQRETEVLFEVMQGNDNKAIAAQLSVGKSTIRKHLESIYRKLGVQSRTEAIAQALTKLGLLHALPLS